MFQTALSQENKSEFSLQINQIIGYNIVEEVETDAIELFTNPREEDKGFNFDVNLNLFTNLGKLPVIIQIGFNQINQTGNLLRVQDTITVENIDSKKNKGVSIGVGISPFTYINSSNFKIRGILSTLFQYNLGGERNFYSCVQTQNDLFLSGTELLIEFSNSYRVGLNLELSTYYVIKDRVGLGLGVRNFLYLSRQNGTTKETRRIFGQNKQLQDEIIISHIENETRFSKSFSLSINLHYLF